MLGKKSGSGIFTAFKKRLEASSTMKKPASESGRALR
jgi:hypothetical protein